ncbi:hypothetical protein D3C76_1817450 [compost metagenome]
MHGETSAFGNKTNDLNDNKHETAAKQHHLVEHPMITLVEVIPCGVIRSVPDTHNIYSNIIHHGDQYGI